MRVYERLAARDMSGKEFSSAVSGPLFLVLVAIVTLAVVVSLWS